MPINATIRSLRAQATQSVDLCFNMPGIIAAQNFDHISRIGPAFLGNRVSSFNIATEVYDHLADVSDADTGRLTYDSNKLRAVLQSSASAPFLFVLRNEALGSALDQAIARRESNWMSRFKHASAIARLASENLPKIVEQLESLRDKSTERFTAVDSAYGDADTPAELKGVLKILRSRTETPGSSSESRTTNLPLAMVTAPMDQNNKTLQEDMETKVLEKETTTVLQRHKSKRNASVPMSYRKADDKWVSPKDPFETQIVNTASAPLEQVMTSSVQALSHPRLENSMGYNQAMTAIYQELLRNAATNLSTPDVEKIILRELVAADADVRIMQLNFVHSFLVSPLDGLVTGVFKDIGESVEPGEPVLRVENDEWLLLLGRLQCRAPLRPGTRVEISVASVFEDGTSLNIPGRIVGIRGHENDNDEWEVIIEVQNPLQGGSRLLPINYTFDPDTDSVRVI